MMRVESIVNIKEYLNSIDNFETNLEEHFKNVLVEDSNLSRQIVSFQANKKTASFRWYKYKEAFSANLVEYFIKKLNLYNKNILDPFAGVGTTLFASSSMGCNSTGIELLPIGHKIIDVRRKAHYGEYDEYISVLKSISENKPWKMITNKCSLNELRITNNAYPIETKNSIELFISYINTLDINIKELLELALLSILEEISYTRKDGQYLRWDYRANRSYGEKSFDKGHIKDFDTAVVLKIDDIIYDLKGEKELTLFDFEEKPGKLEKGIISLIKGSCLEELIKIKSNSFDAVITSPPYCNRYDYTRTYALELALLGVDEKQLSNLRQEMLSCTVENKEKNLLQMNPRWNNAVLAVKDVLLLEDIMNYLNIMKDEKQLNNNGITRMIKGYFYEIACVIYELNRILKKRGLLAMVNDNVRYAGICIPVDLILSKIAESIGFKVKDILILPQKKGNSSQQMGVHGRKELRKCVYIWEKI